MCLHIRNITIAQKKTQENWKEFKEKTGAIK